MMEWSQPANISRSGAASTPSLLINKNNQLLAFWRDAQSGYMTSLYDGNKWQTPSSSLYPFDVSAASNTTNLYPSFVVDKNNIAHAFWINSRNTLFYSKVEFDRFSTQQRWSAAAQITDSAVSYNVTIDAANKIHLVYARAIDSASSVAGVYYRSLSEGGIVWSDPVLLYDSPYLRGTTGDNIRINLVATGSSSSVNLYASWDFVSRKRVFLATSSNGGRTWAPVKEMEGPTPATENQIPQRISIGANSDNVIAIWQVSQIGGTCIQVYSSSNDAGKTWSDRRQMLTEFNGCPQDNQLSPAFDSAILLMTTIRDQVYMMVWDGKRWSEIQSQAELLNFVDPDTLDSVNFRSRKMSLVGDVIYVIGSDSKPGADVWITSRKLGRISDWFPTEMTWQKPETITYSTDHIGYSAVTIDANGMIHAFWNQAMVEDTAGKINSIHYSRLESKRWTAPTSILTSPSGKTGEFSITIDKKDRLLAVWSGGLSGQIYFSWANSNKADNPLEWAPPLLLPTPWPMGASPVIQVGKDGVIYVVFAVPLNEKRGIYLTISRDEGKTWEDPQMVFNAAASQWEMVDKPNLAIGIDGNIHVLWRQFSIPQTSTPLSLYYSRSTNGGKKWSEPELILEKTILWSQIISYQNSVHRFWQEKNGNRIRFYHQRSLNSGESWENVILVDEYSGTHIPSGVLVDSFGRLHLLLLSQTPTYEILVNYRTWNDIEGWTKKDAYSLGVGKVDEIDNIQAVLTQQGFLAVLYGSWTLAKDQELAKDGLYLVQRKVDEPSTAILQTAAAPTRIIASSTPTPQSTSAPLNTPFPTLVASTQPSQTPDSWSGVILGGLIATGAVAFLFIILVYIIRRPRK